ncbi:Uncharacterised protein [Neisseria meningitidis]|nr:Uncharacterised protein [Neisseria meningitidis]
MAGGLRGKGKGDERHHPGCGGVNQFAPPCDGVDSGVLAVVLEVADVGGQFADGHLVGFDEQYVHQVAFDGNRPVFFSRNRDLDFVFAKRAAADVFQLPTAVAVQNGGIGFHCLCQFVFIVAGPDFNAQQGMVGQHFAHIDNAVFFFEPKAGIAGADFAVDGRGFDVFGFLAQCGRNPFAERDGGNSKNKTELRQNQQQLFGAHAAGFDDGQFAAGGKLAEGDQSADKDGEGNQFVGAGGHFEGGVAQHFPYAVTAFAEVAGFVQDFKKAVQSEEGKERVNRHNRHLTDDVT